jgi:hypothetical protein
MKKVLILMAVAAIATPGIAGYSAIFADGPGPNYSSGGPFIATVTGFGTFPTFCVEHVTFSTGINYWFTIDDKIYNGGTSPITLDINTQKLYASYLSLSAGDQSTYGQDFQQAIWFLEGVNSTPDPGNIAALIALGDSSAYTNVRVLNLWGNSTYTDDKQSHLIMVPAPGALLLGSLGMGLVGWLRRRQAV